MFEGVSTVNFDNPLDPQEWLGKVYGYATARVRFFSDYGGVVDLGHCPVKDIENTLTTLAKNQCLTGRLIWIEKEPTLKSGE